MNNDDTVFYKNYTKLLKKLVKVKYLRRSHYFSGCILLSEAEPAFDFLPEAFTEYENTQVEGYFTRDNQPCNNSCNLGLCISEPWYYQNEEEGYC